MENRRVSESLTIASSPEALYAMVSDVTRMGEWSPVCKLCWWEDETRSKVVADDPDREFAFAVNGDRTRWGYTFEPTDGGTLVTESWEILPRSPSGDRTRALVCARPSQPSSGSPRRRDPPRQLRIRLRSGRRSSAEISQDHPIAPPARSTCCTSSRG